MHRSRISCRPMFGTTQRRSVTTTGRGFQTRDAEMNLAQLVGRALDKIEFLRPKAVVAGHGVLDPDSSPRHIEETRRYLRDFVASLASTSTAIELYQTMLSLHPD